MTNLAPIAELALAAEDAGQAMGRLGRLDHARGLLDRAAVIYERLEAARDLARIEATMRQLGISSRAQLAAEAIRQPGRG
jgi:hypothetical protein